MEPNTFLEAPLVGASDSSSNNVAETSQSDDTEECPISQNTHTSSESSAVLDPLLQSGRNNSRARVTQPAERASRELNRSKATASKPPTSNLSLLIYTAVATCRKKSGLSMQALKKVVTSMGYDMVKKKHFFLRSVKNMVAKGQLRQVKGTGATGSFKVNPDIGKKSQPKMRGKGQKAKDSIKKKRRPTTLKNGQETAKKQVKADVKRTCKKGKVSSVQAAQNQVKV